MGTVIVALLVFGLLVVFHELGHFGIAKLVGIKVHEFAIGMGPKLLKVNGKETAYTIRLFPIGGFVKMEGEDEASTDQRSFNNKPLFARMMVIAAGPVMNFLLAVLLFMIIFYAVGFPTTTIKQVTEGFPAEKVGIKPGDQIIAINDKEVNEWDEVVSIISKAEGTSLQIEIKRDSTMKEFTVIPILNKDLKQYMIGITPMMEKSLGKSVQASFERLIFVMKGMTDFFVKLFGGKASTEEVVGPVGIIHLVGEAAKTSVFSVLSLAALISVNLGIVNLIPVPALDGGRLLFLIVEGIRGKAIDPEKEGFLHFIVFVLLITLMLFITYKDLMRFDIF
ncbi:MAG: RIP metalloprotease RseP [Bacillota bacterium]